MYIYIYAKLSLPSSWHISQTWSDPAKEKPLKLTFPDSTVVIVSRVPKHHFEHNAVAPGPNENFNGDEW